MYKRLGGTFVLLLLTGSLTADDFGQSGQSLPGSEKIAMIQGCAQLAASIVQKSYSFFNKDLIACDLQVDVLDHPYKNMLYTTTQAIEKLFDQANQHDNPHLQIKALILLCRMPVPEWYLKNFYKGMDQLFLSCFDESGNFKDASHLGDIRLMFKEYCKKTPCSWQQVARMSPWWYKNKKPYAVHTKYYAMSCTEYNEGLLRMIELDPVQDLAYLKYLVSQHNSAPALKIYKMHVIDMFKDSLDTSLLSDQ